MIGRKTGGLAIYLLSLCGFLVSFYFVSSALTGSHSLAELHSLEDETRRIENEWRTLKDRHENLTARNAALSPEQLDLDLLETQLRGRLGYIRDGEIQIR